MARARRSEEAVTTAEVSEEVEGEGRWCAEEAEDKDFVAMVPENSGEHGDALAGETCWRSSSLVRNLRIATPIC